MPRPPEKIQPSPRRYRRHLAALVKSLEAGDVPNDEASRALILRLARHRLVRSVGFSKRLKAIAGEIETQPHMSRLSKDYLQAQVSRLEEEEMPAAERRSIWASLDRGIISKPPEPERPKDSGQTVSGGGKTVTRPSRFAPAS